MHRTGQREAEQGRVIVHFDADAFYAQCEEIRDPSLKTRPLGITQKYLIVTSNYHARQRGVGKLMSIKEAQQLCPDLVLISGEDLTPYRQASKRVLAVLQRFGVAEKLGMDEVVVDVTEEVKSRIALGSAVASWNGHVHHSQVGVVQENRHRVMDLRASAAAPAAEHQARQQPELIAEPWQLQLMVGSQIAAEARAALKAEAGFRSSAGISVNRMLAKLSSGLHKPDDQTVLPPTEAAAFVAPLPLRAIPGVGSKLDGELKQLGLELVEQLQPWSQQSLVQRFGERIGTFLYLACRGLDPTPVKAKQPSKAVTVEDSFKSCTSPEAVRHVLQILAPDLLARLREEYEDGARRPKTLTLKWRHRDNGWSRTSASCPMPAAVQVIRAPKLEEVEAVVQAAMALFLNKVSGSFVLTLLNLGATNFVAVEAGASGGLPPVFARLLGKRGMPTAAEQPAVQHAGGARAANVLTHSRRDYGSAPAGAPISKTEERRLRELSAAAPAAQADAEHEPRDCWESADDVLDGCEQREATPVPSCFASAGDDAGQLSVAVRCVSGGGPGPGEGQLPGAGPTAARAECSTVLAPATTHNAHARPPPSAVTSKVDRTREELLALRALLSAGSDCVETDGDMRLARRLQAEELGLEKQAATAAKRRTVGTLDAYFSKRRAK